VSLDSSSKARKISDPPRPFDVQQARFDSGTTIKTLQQSAGAEEPPLIRFLVGLATRAEEMTVQVGNWRCA